MDARQTRLKELESILEYREDDRRDSRVPEAYREWRALTGRPIWCDNSSCQLHCEDPKWNNEPAPLEVDHIDGCRYNNRTKNLQLLCGNCHALQPTTGGRNKGLIKRSETGGGYARLDRATGRRHFRLPAKSGHFAITGGSATLGGVADRELVEGVETPGDDGAVRASREAYAGHYAITGGSATTDVSDRDFVESVGVSGDKPKF